MYLNTRVFLGYPATGLAARVGTLRHLHQNVMLGNWEYEIPHVGLYNQITTNGVCI